MHFGPARAANAGMPTELRVEDCVFQTKGAPRPQEGARFDKGFKRHSTTDKISVKRIRQIVRQVMPSLSCRGRSNEQVKKTKSPNHFNVIKNAPLLRPIGDDFVERGRPKLKANSESLLPYWMWIEQNSMFGAHLKLSAPFLGTVESEK